MRWPTTNEVLIYFGLRDDPTRPDDPDENQGLSKALSLLLIVNGIGIVASPDGIAWGAARLLVAGLLCVGLLRAWHRSRSGS